MKTASSRTMTTGAARLRKKRKRDAPDTTAKVKGEENPMVVVNVSMKNGEKLGRSMAIDGVKLDEELIHGEMRILIKVGFVFEY